MAKDVLRSWSFKVSYRYTLFSIGRAASKTEERANLLSQEEEEGETASGIDVLQKFGSSPPTRHARSKEHKGHENRRKADH